VAGSIDALSSALPEHSLYLVNYRGYGGSSGRPTEKGLFVDGLAVFDHVRTRHSSVAVMGRSLGSGVGAYVASRRPVESLVLVTPFDSLVNVARDHLPHLPVRLLLRDRYDSASRTRDVTSPVLVVMAQEDEIIPEVRSSALVAAFPEDQVLVEVVPGVGHNTLDRSPAYLGSVRAFLSRTPESID
jgi:pimeloyl-ACP methyl ester carboxylesterase